MNSFIITSLLANLHEHQRLLAPTIISPQAQTAIDTLISMVNSLPADNCTLEYLISNPLSGIEVNATFKDGIYTLLQQSYSFQPGYARGSVSNHAGVYL